MTTTPTPAQPEAPGSGRELERYVQQLRSTDVTLRSDAAHALGKLADERAVPALAEALRDQDEYVRKSAVMALRRIGGHGAMEAMRAALADRSEQVCVQAVKGLGELRDAGAVEALVKVLARRERSLVSAATEALSRIGAEAVPALMEAFKDRYLRRRIGPQVWRILTDMGPRIVEPLLAVLGDENYYVKLTALTILGRVGDRRVVAPIVQTFLSDPRLQETVVVTGGRPRRVASGGSRAGVRPRRPRGGARRAPQRDGKSDRQGAAVRAESALRPAWGRGVRAAAALSRGRRPGCEAPFDPAAQQAAGQARD
jgi:hypothetical protein